MPDFSTYVDPNNFAKPEWHIKMKALYKDSGRKKFLRFAKGDQ